MTAPQLYLVLEKLHVMELSIPFNIIGKGVDCQDAMETVIGLQSSRSPPPVFS